MATVTLADVLARETREGELYDVLPDGRFVTTASVNSLGPEGRQINVVVNWQEELKQRVPTR